MLVFINNEKHGQRDNGTTSSWSHTGMANKKQKTTCCHMLVACSGLIMYTLSYVPLVLVRTSLAQKQHDATEHSIQCRNSVYSKAFNRLQTPTLFMQKHTRKSTKKSRSNTCVQRISGSQLMQTPSLAGKLGQRHCFPLG